MLGIDSDNGAEFINAQLIRYCKEHEITFTRSRPYRKNDSCFVEQKNWSVIRRAIGYGWCICIRTYSPKFSRCYKKII